MNVKLRKFPYPFKAMLAISNDIDSTTPETFEYIHRVIKSPENKIELNFSDSIWVFAANSSKGKQLSFYDLSTDELTPYWRKLRYYVSKGWLDTLHTYGNFSRSEQNVNFNREYAKKSVDFLAKHKISFDVWVNHGDENNIQNLGNYAYMQGATEGSEAYHYDLCKGIGIKYIWNPKLRDIFGHPTMLSPFTLKNGDKIWSFPRFHSYFVSEAEKSEYIKRGVDFWGKDKDEAVLWHPSFLDLQITRERLEKLCDDAFYSVITQHFGNIKDTGNKFTKDAINALELLSEFSKEKINVVSTSKLLNYNRANDYLEYEVFDLPSGSIINITSINDPVLGRDRDVTLDKLDGITFYTDKPDKTFFMINGKMVKPEATKRNDSDGFNSSVSIFSKGLNIEFDISDRFKIAREFNKAVSEDDSLSSDEKLTKKPSLSLWERAISKAKNHNKKNKVPDKNLSPVICIGGMKCGTSTLWDMLTQHPEVLSCSVKEPSYFAVRDIEGLSVDEYYSIWPWDRANNKHKVIFEASTHYSKFPASETAADQIGAILPNAKIIYLVRDPIKRLESQLAHHISRGELDVDLINAGMWKENTHLFNLSSYNQRISPFVRNLGKDNILVITLEELIHNYRETLYKIESFLSLSHFSDYSELKKSNPRRQTLGADKVSFGSDDMSHIYDVLKEDIELFKGKFSIDSKKWETWSRFSHD
ncbi:sulfotransferase family protein [Vibrio crassostreae]|uniref:sulfotransferase family protein n=1 Tax=Vibrio crassostreae TaxID=246167 RepID=UPI001B30A7E7|nr:sulfotransferase [Vibrio crassostreae]